MQLLEGDYVYSATDLNNYLECRHLVALGREVAQGRLRKPDVVDLTAELVARKGSEHEQAQLEAYVAQHGTGVVRFDERPPNSRAGLLAAEALTLEAMASGAAIIYQATFFDGRFVGHADFLRRVERPCTRWAWSYEVIDTKLALSPKPYFLIQLCNYSEHLERLQGTAPEHGYVVFGNREERPFRIATYGAYYRHLRDAFLHWMETGEDAYPLEVPHCDVCVWTTTCEQRREKDDHLSLVAGIRGDQIDKLEDAGITTMTALAEASRRPHRMTDAMFRNLRTQAELQLEQRRNIAAGVPNPYRYRFRGPEDGEDSEETSTAPSNGNHPAPLSRGNAAAPSCGNQPAPAPSNGLVSKRPDPVGFGKMPEPARGDIFFDIEGDPLYRADRGLEYLFGVYLPDEDRYEGFWATNPSEERAAFEQCVDFIEARRKRYPGMHVYHYAAYEKTALGRLMGTFASRENEVDRFFTIGLFVDLYPVVRQAMWISQPSYSLKKVEDFYGWRRETQTRGGDDSIVMFESWLATGDAAILEDIRRYNEDDCRSTHALREWLVTLRAEYNALRAERNDEHSEPIPWRAAQTEPPPEEPLERTALEASLLAGISPPADLTELRLLPDAVRERWLLGNILQYHRRENKPAYWEYFHRCEYVEELVEFDRKAIGSLRRRLDIPPRALSARDRNLVYTYEYPLQEHDLGPVVHCPDLQKPVTEIVTHDELARIIELKLSSEMAASLRALIPGPPISHKARQLGLERIAELLLAGRLESDHAATSALLRAAMPRFIGLPAGATIQPPTVDGSSLADAIARLDNSYLFVQGPPGSGKSTFGAEAVVTLLRAGKRIGLMANCHKALHGLLHKIEATASKAGYRFSGLHKSSDSTEDSDFVSRLDVPMVRSATKVVALDAELVSGTAFFWPTVDPPGQFDVMIIDEAGQVSIADALNASIAARNVVLLGDPQQLPQVVQGWHPVGTGRSILDHLLDSGATQSPLAEPAALDTHAVTRHAGTASPDADTVAPDRGIFMDVSFRMQPDLARFVSETSYDGRLHADPRTAGNRVDSSGLRGGGLAYLPVSHEGNGRYSMEEASLIVEEVRALLRDGTFVHFGAAPERIVQEHILIVAPYNLQRRKIRELLEASGFRDVAVGTVDKFQGQQAPVVFYSMATSSGDDLPRDMGFLFDRNRFNVAISRAQCLSVLVCSPRLLDVRCRNAEQMGLVSLLCGFVERQTVEPPTSLSPI